MVQHLQEGMSRAGLIWEHGPNVSAGPNSADSHYEPTAASSRPIRKGDFVIVRTGHQERCLAKKDWTGYAGGGSPGLAFRTCYWLKEKDVAAICTYTWGCEVRPNETEDANQPWHWVVIPAMGISMGEIFYLKELAADCAADKVFEFFFSAPPLHLPGGAGSPTNPQAIK